MSKDRNAIKINKTVNGSELTFELDGRLDINTAPLLDEEISKSIEGVESLTFDAKKLRYISSAGLRVLLKTQKIMNSQGTMKIINADEDIKDIFDLTGFNSMINVL